MGLFDEKPRKGKVLKAVNYKGQGSSGNKGGGGKQKEIVQKVASNIKGNNCGNSLDYITRNNNHENETEEFIEPENEMGDVLSKEKFEELKEEWKLEFSEPKKVNSRNMTHLILSVDIDDTKSNQEKLQNAARDYLAERFADEGFRYVFVQHNDTNKPHVHILVNNNNLETGKKLRIDMDWHYESRVMFKEHLKNHGINKEATFKKDRQIIKEKEQNFHKDDSKVTNWFEAKLKQASQNDKHLEHLKRQFTIIQELKKDMNQSERFSTQKQLELSERLKALKGDIVLHDRFTSRTEANKAVHSMIKEIDPQKQTLLKAVERSDQKNEQAQAANEKKYQRQLYFHAKELVKAEAILKATPHNSLDKKDALKRIKDRKSFLASKGIDVKKLEQDHRVDLSQNDKFKMAYREINKVVPQTNKQVKKDKSLDHEATKKRFVRALDKLYSAEQNNTITQTDKKTLDSIKTKVLIDLESKGFPAKKTFQDWQEARSFKTSVTELKSSIESNKQQSNETQKQLFVLKEKLQQSPPKLLGKKEAFTLAVNLRKAQEQLDKSTGNDFGEYQKQANNLNKGIKSLDDKVKQTNQTKAKSQSFAMTARLSALQEEKHKLLDSQKQWLSEQTKQIEQALYKRGVNVGKYQQQLRNSDNVHKRVNELEGVTMNRIRSKGFDRAEKNITTLKQEVNESSLTTRSKRQLSKAINTKQKEINQDKALSKDQIAIKTKQLERLMKDYDAAKSMSNNTLSALERLNNKRHIESLSKDIVKLCKQVQPMVRSIGGKNMSQQLKDINTMSRKVGGSIERDR